MGTLGFGWLAEYWPLILQGIATTFLLTVVGGICGTALGTGLALLRKYGPRPLKAVSLSYCEMVRNTPFLIQMLFIFLGLPALGVRMPSYAAAALAMVLNLGGYSAEIIRAGIEATPSGMLEAGASLALTRSQIFRTIVFRPALGRVWPALSSQIVLEMLGSAVVSQISVTDLTYAMNFVQSRNFRAFETYLVGTIIYLVLAILLRRLLIWLGSSLFPKEAAL